jgi:tetraacyldisaccharide 4'-kinase
MPRKLALAPLTPLSTLYGVASRGHRMLYRRGWRTPARLPAFVVSVGNLSVGGSGKTPTAAWLARELHARGRRVALLSRGVGGRRIREVNVVSDGAHLLLGPREVGDEPVWLSQAAPGVPVLAGRERSRLGLRAVSAFGSEILILDDGFQHHRVQRDLDLVCIDARLGLGNGYVLPRGPLREHAGALRYADALVVTRASSPQDCESIRGIDDRHFDLDATRFCVGIAPVRLRALSDRRERPLTDLSSAPVGVLTAIARPDRLCADLERRGAIVTQVRAFADHHLYRRSDLERLPKDVHWITTSKDAVKIPSGWLEGRVVEVLEEAVHGWGTPSLSDWVLQRVEREQSKIG